MGATLRAAARGAVGAMAMTGLRRITTTLGLVRETPPESVVDDAASGLVGRVPPKHRLMMVEAAHLGYGVTGGALFGLMSARVRLSPKAGPAYGAAAWLVFDRVIAPAMGLPQATDPKLGERLALLADHVLYGMVVAGATRP